MLSNAYFVAKIHSDTAENEPAKNLQNLQKIAKILIANFANFANRRSSATLAFGLAAAGKMRRSGGRPPRRAAGNAEERRYRRRARLLGIGLGLAKFMKIIKIL